MRLRLTTITLSISAVLAIAPPPSIAGVAISITIAPPVLPVYVQPACPLDGYLWTPGYWAWGPNGYYWVPGVWVAPPVAGVLWTPGYWGFAGGIYAWHPGYWGTHVGFYGGVNYGFGYSGIGFVGGVWAGSIFRYNTAVLNVNTTVVRNVYIDRTVIRQTTVINRTSFNGPGGIVARPAPQELMAAREQHFQPTTNQISHQQFAARDRSQFASVNHGRPETVAMDSVNGRRFNQQARIASAAAAGRPNANEPRNLENRPAGVNREARADRQANAGREAAEERQRHPGKREARPEEK